LSERPQAAEIEFSYLAIRIVLSGLS